MAKGYIESTETVIKDEFGVDRVTTIKKVFKHNSDKENFYFVFVNYVQWMYDLQGIIPIKILHFLLEEAQINTGRVILSTGKKQRLIAKLGISRMSFYNAMKQLVDNKIISKIYYKSEDEQDRYLMYQIHSYKSSTNIIDWTI